MSRPVNVQMPCDGDAFAPIGSGRGPRKCTWCRRFYRNWNWGTRRDGTCTGPDGWPLMAHAAAEVARERGEGK